MSKRRVDIKPPPCTYCGTEDDFFSNPVLYWYDVEADWKTYACGKCTIKALKSYEHITKSTKALDEW